MQNLRPKVRVCRSFIDLIDEGFEVSHVRAMFTLSWRITRAQSIAEANGQGSEVGLTAVNGLPKA
jgi:hypothetical protein